MNKEEINDILEELHLVRPEILQPKAKKLFTAIMIIADERDKYKKAIDEIATRLEYFLIGNLKYQSSQDEFIKLLNILNEVSE